MFRFAYNTNGLAHHRLHEAFDLLAELGYRGVALTPDVGELDPLRPDPATVRRLADRARELDLALVVETGARFVLDPRRKHRPSLLEDRAAERGRRIDFYRASIDLAHDLGAPIVSIWSGASPSNVVGDARTSSHEASEALWERLCSSLLPVLDHARAVGVRIAFEPEPGMFVERPSGYLEIVRRLGARGSELGLTLDVGHLLVTNDVPVGTMIQALATHLVHVHLDDIRGHRHEHLMFGQGDLDLVGVLAALKSIEFQGLAAVELSRDSHRGAEAAAEALRHLRRAL